MFNDFPVVSNYDKFSAQFRVGRLRFIEMVGFVLFILISCSNNYKNLSTHSTKHRSLFEATLFRAIFMAKHICVAGAKNLTYS